MTSTSPSSTSPTHEHYDLIIIGSGSGNSIPGPDFADKKIALLEKGHFGGTCLNVGCIPTKMFVLAADAATTVSEASRLGVHAHVDSVDWDSIKARVFDQRIDPISSSGKAWRRGEENPNLDVYDGHARFIGPKTISTSSDGHPVTITGDTIVIAAGARPAIPQVYADSGVKFHTNETVMRMDKLPKSMIVVGGGFIAAEFAHVFHALGVEVTQINRSHTLLKQADKDISEAFTAAAGKQWTTILGVTATEVTEKNHTITVTLNTGETISAETLLIATGRTPNGDLLDLEATGVTMTGARIATDEFGRTKVPGIWAVGDVSSPYQLKHVANAETRTVVHNLTHPEDLKPLPHTAVPAAVFTHPQIASVGLTEAQAQETGRNLTIKTQRYGDVAYGWALEDTTSFLKLIADADTGELLGAHIIGPQASTIIQQLVTVMALGISLKDFARSQYWIHPALPELTENAILGLEFTN